MSADHDPQPRRLLDDPWFADALLGEIRGLTRILYPEARIPETAMSRFRIIEAESESDPNSHRNAVHIGDDTDPHLFTVWARGQGNGSGRVTAERGIKNPAELEMWQRAHQLCDLLNRDWDDIKRAEADADRQIYGGMFTPQRED